MFSKALPAKSQAIANIPYTPRVAGIQTSLLFFLHANWIMKICWSMTKVALEALKRDY